MGNGTTEICAAHLLFVLLLQLQSIEAQIDFALKYAGAVMGELDARMWTHLLQLQSFAFFFGWAFNMCLYTLAR